MTARRLAIAACLACALVAAVVVLVEAAHRRAPLRGPTFGPDGDAYLVREAMRAEAIDIEPTLRLLLVGDAGAPEPREDPTLSLVGRWADADPERTTVLFLGDNVYPAGISAEDPAQGRRILLRLLETTSAFKIFVPGNHDWGWRWNRRDPTGALARQQRFIEERADLGAVLLPEDGCPGPAVAQLLEPGGDLDGGLTLVLIDLHWWFLEEDQRPSCHGIADTSAFVEALSEVLSERSGQNVIVAAHHPIRSGGPHGGLTRGFWRDLGLVFSRHFYASQDLIEPDYREAVRLLSAVLRENPPLAMVGGHDHSLQILDGGDEAGIVAVSGAATRVSQVGATEGTLFAHAHRGFIAFDFYGTPTRAGPELLLAKVVEVGEADPVAMFAVELDGAPEPSHPVSIP